MMRSIRMAHDEGAAAEAALNVALALAAVTRAQLTVAGLRHRRRLRRAVPGSVAATLARRSPCPVLLVPAPGAAT